LKACVNPRGDEGGRIRSDHHGGKPSAAAAAATAAARWARMEGWRRGSRLCSCRRLSELGGDEAFIRVRVLKSSVCLHTPRLGVCVRAWFRA
jgi:hypothetical protein